MAEAYQKSVTVAISIWELVAIATHSATGHWLVKRDICGCGRYWFAAADPSGREHVGMTGKPSTMMEA
jgi:hypothetical protein